MRIATLLTLAALIALAGATHADDGEGDHRTDPGDFFHYDAPGEKSFSHDHDGMTGSATAQDSISCALPGNPLAAACPRDLDPPAGWDARGVWDVKFQPFEIPTTGTVNHTISFRIAKWADSDTLSCLPGTEYTWSLDWDHRVISSTCAIG